MKRLSGIYDLNLHTIDFDSIDATGTRSDKMSMEWIGTPEPIDPETIAEAFLTPSLQDI